MTTARGDETGRISDRPSRSSLSAGSPFSCSSGIITVTRGEDVKAMATKDVWRPALPVRNAGSVRASGEPTGSDIALATVEASVAELLRAYKRALKFAANMPLLGRCKVLGGWRWGSRFFTKLYVEVHVRRQLQTIRSCLAIELFGTAAAEERQRVVTLEAELAECVGPLLGWRRLAGLLTRLPPVAAALPVVSAASVWPVNSDVSAGDFIKALIMLGATGLTLWLLVVWPSVRLGFRTKRAILTGGRDVRHPLLFDPGTLRWRWCTVSRVYDDRRYDIGFLFVERLITGVRRTPAGGDRVERDEATALRTKLRRLLQARRQRLFRRNRQRLLGTKRQPLPRANVYELEDRVFELLGRRKPTEIPLDMLFAVVPYLLFAVSALCVVALVDAAASGVGVDPRFWFFLLLLFLLVLLPFQFVLQMIRNHRQRPH